MKSKRRQCMELGDQRKPRKGRGFGGSRNPRTRVGGSDYGLHVPMVVHPVLIGPQAASSPVEISEICIDIRTKRDVQGVNQLDASRRSFLF